MARPAKRPLSLSRCGLYSRLPRCKELIGSASDENRFPFQVLILLILFTTQVVPVQKKQAVHPARPKLPSIKRDVASPGAASTREKAILAEINLARSNPSRYVHHLEDFRRYYHGNELRLPDGQSLTTHEGVKALDDAINFLLSLRPLSPLELSSGMALGARDHLNDLVKTGRSGHRDRTELCLEIVSVAMEHGANP